MLRNEPDAGGKMRRLSLPILMFALGPLLLAAACGKKSGTDDDAAVADAGPDAFVPYDHDAAVPNCEADPPVAEALLPAGPDPAGGTILIGGRRVNPRGQIVPIGGYPINAALFPGGDHLVITDSGWRDHRLHLVDAVSGTVLDTHDTPFVFYGLAVTQDGSTLYAGGGNSQNVLVYDIDLAAGTMTEGTPLLADGVFVGAVALTPAEDRLLVADNNLTRLVVLDTQTGAELERLQVGTQPYDILVDAARDQFVISLWGERHIAFYDLSTYALLDEIETGKNPEKLLLAPDGTTMFVVNSDSDTLSRVDLATRTVVDTIAVGVWQTGLRGISPNHIALSPGGQRLLVSSGGTNSVEVFDTVSLGHIGSIPTAWYPTGLLMSPSTDLLYILNMKGFGSGPSPNAEGARNLMAGNLQIVALPTDQELQAGTQEVLANQERLLNLEPTLSCSGTPEVFPVPQTLGDPTPIEHVVLLVRENKTYDSELGDLGTGNGDPSLAIFDEFMTPNLHALARQFTSLDNYYTNGEVSIQGHHWLTAIMNNDFYEKTVPGDEGRGFAGYFSAPIGWPEGGFVWGYLIDNGVDFINYGEGDGTGAHALQGLDLDFPGIVYNTSELDVIKAAYVVDRIESGFMPSFTFLLLPNNHTEGTTPGRPTPESMIADNDEATGMVVDAISRSVFWPRTAIFIVEDDPLQGGDHVEAHRSICLVVSPWAKRGYTSSVHGDIPSVWKTIFLILGLPPLGIYDANTAALYDAFTGVPDYTPYDGLPRNIPEAINPIDAPFAEESMMMDFSGPDRAPGLNRLLWRYFRGTEPPWPDRPRLDEELDGD